MSWITESLTRSIMAHKHINTGGQVEVQQFRESVGVKLLLF